MKLIVALFFAVMLARVESRADGVRLEDSEKEHRIFHFSCAFSEESANPDNLAFDLSGLSAGLGFDLVPGWLDGIQFAGIAAAAESFRGLQTAPLMTLSETGLGLQVSIVASWTMKRFEGIQLSGAATCASGAGIQISCILNETDDCFNLDDRYHNDGRKSEWTGLQLAGICNRACFLDGVQTSLCYNYAVRCRGIQLAPWNDVDELHGLQIGLINEARSGAGVQIGLFNFFGSGDGRLLLPLVNARF